MPMGITGDLIGFILSKVYDPSVPLEPQAQPRIGFLDNYGVLDRYRREHVLNILDVALMRGHQWNIMTLITFMYCVGRSAPHHLSNKSRSIRRCWENSNISSPHRIKRSLIRHVVTGILLVEHSRPNCDSANQGRSTTSSSSCARREHPQVVHI
ncbi:hypothetical protein BDN72DRAFT_500088 [Pluteus cervinus]|uniref:Uncharacterized protein n=1 Tax=Pluteus cervinus TaxID=181527 RepID=A0ACD3AZT7_9AGAR|nr:hypothetical protein BDN72DRAFT_500088 [Pluteus cervinus]